MNDLAHGFARLVAAGAGALAAAVVGAFLFHFLGDVAFEQIDRHAPGYFRSHFDWATRHSTPDFDAARKMAWGYLLFYSGFLGFISSGVAAFAFLFFRLGGVMSIVRAYGIILAGGLLGGLLGWGVGYLMGSHIPGFLRALVPWGDKPFFDPLHMGIGLGIFVGLLTGLAVGGVASIIYTWWKVHDPARQRVADES